MRVPRGTESIINEIKTCTDRSMAQLLADHQEFVRENEEGQLIAIMVEHVDTLASSTSSWSTSSWTTRMDDVATVNRTSGPASRLSRDPSFNEMFFIEGDEVGITVLIPRPASSTLNCSTSVLGSQPQPRRCRHETQHRSTNSHLRVACSCLERLMSSLLADLQDRLDPERRNEFEERAGTIEFDSKRYPGMRPRRLALIDLLRSHPAALVGVTALDVDHHGRPTA